jgi:hypothetical protein
MRLQRGIVVLVAASAATFAGCGSSAMTVPQATSVSTTSTQANTGTPSGALTKAQAARKYLAAIAQGNAVQNAFLEKANKWNDSTTDAEAEKDAQPLISALTDQRTSLLSIANSYQPAAADIKAVINDDASLIGDLENLATLKDPNTGQSLEHQIVSDLNKSSAASAIVRSDLGISPPSKS